MFVPSAFMQRAGSGDCCGAEEGVCGFNWWFGCWFLMRFKIYFDADPFDCKIYNTELLNLYQQVDSLPDASQQALVLVIDGMVKKAQMEKVVGKRSAKR